MKLTEEDEEGKSGVRAAVTLKKNFYVDNTLKSVSTEEGPVELMHAVRGRCVQGRFKLKKSSATVES